MLFTQQVFHIECLLFFQIESQPGVAYKSVDYKKAFEVACRVQIRKKNILSK